MKKFLIRIIRSILYALVVVCISVAALILYNGHAKLSLNQSVLLFSVPLCLAVICYFFATRTGNFTTIEECKAEFSDVSWMERHHILILCVGQLSLLFVALACNFGDVAKYDTLFSDADRVILDEYNGSETSLVIYKSLPTWYAERALIGAQSIGNAEAVLNDTEMTSTEQSNKVTDIADNMDARFHDLKLRAGFGITALLLFGWLFMYSKRLQQYHSAMRRLEKAGK